MMDHVSTSEGRSPEEERLHRRQRLAAAFRIFARLDFDEGGAGHVTARDPELTDHFWVNPSGAPFDQIRTSDLLLVDPLGRVVEGEGSVNLAGFFIHSRIHRARPDVVAVAHAHSVHGKAWAALGRHLDPITQEACVFFRAHGVYDDFHGPVLDEAEGDRLAAALGDHKAVILRNHGLLTVGETVESAVFRFVSMDRSCRVQLLAEAAGQPRHIDAELARELAATPGYSHASFQPLWSSIVRKEPDLLD